MNSDWWVAAPIVGVAVLIAAFALFVVYGPTPHRRERELSDALGSQGIATTARILHTEREPGGDTYATATTLDVAVPTQDGGERQVRLHVLIDRELMVNFMPGKTVALRYDPADATRIAVDRHASPTEIPAPWRQ